MQHLALLGRINPLILVDMTDFGHQRKFWRNSAVQNELLRRLLR